MVGLRSDMTNPNVRRAVFSACLILVVMMTAGCSLGNRFFFSSKGEFTATPARYGVPYEDVWFNAPDGVSLNGWFAPGDPGVPLILYFHGNGGNLSDCAEYLKLLHDLGFPVFVFDYRGYGQSRGETLREDDLYKDARGAIAYLERRGWRHEGMVYYGQSLGGAVAVQMAIEAPPAGLVLESAFTSFADIAKKMAPVSYTLTGWCCIDVRFDNMAKIAGVTVPILLVHGDKDPVAPVEMSRRLFAQARAPKMLYIISGGGHCDAVRFGGVGYRDAWRTLLRTITLPVAEKSARP
jgi:pimeloyl-ACP methyl ester carboxylesterase